MSEASRISIIPFDGKDFPLWKIKVQAYMAGQGWSSAIKKESEIKAEIAAAGKDADAYTRRLAESQPKVYALLVNSLSNDILSLFAASATGNPQVMWNALVEHYERNTTANRHATRALLMGQRLGEGEDISVYVSRILSLSQKLHSMGQTISEEDQLFVLFNGLTHEYASYSAMLQLRDKLTFVDAVKSLKDQQELLKLNPNSNNTANFATNLNKFNKQKGRFNNKKNTNTNKTGKTDNDGSGKYCKIHKTKGHTTKECSLANATCHSCGRKGHIKKFCYHNKDRKESEDEKKDTSACQAEEYSAQVVDLVSSSYPVAHLFDYDAFVSSYDHKNADAFQHASLCDDMIKCSEYMLDSGASSHYVNNINALSDIINLPVPKYVTVANGQREAISIMGTLRLVGDSGNIIVLKEVKYVPSFNTNLISISKLTNNGASVEFSKNDAKLVRGGQVLLTAKRNGDLYNINHTCNDEKANSATSTSLSLFHQRIGHLSMSSIKQLLDQEAVQGIDKLKNEIGKTIHTPHMCEGCAMGKSHRTAFKSYSLKPVADQVCNRMYGDLSGPSTSRICLVCC
jgi:hypothetical protein